MYYRFIYIYKDNIDNKMNRKPSEYRRNECKHKKCFYCLSNKEKANIDYSTVLQWESSVKDRVSKMQRKDIAQGIEDGINTPLFLK